MQVAAASCGRTLLCTTRRTATVTMTMTTPPAAASRMSRSMTSSVVVALSRRRCCATRLPMSGVGRGGGRHGVSRRSFQAVRATPVGGPFRTFSTVGQPGGVRRTAAYLGTGAGILAVSATMALVGWNPTSTEAAGGGGGEGGGRGGDPLGDVLSRLRGFFDPSTTPSSKEGDEGVEGTDGDGDDDGDTNDNGGDKDDRTNDPTAAAKVVVELDPEMVDSLPLMDLDEVCRHDGLSKTDRLLVTHDGIVYDVTEFALHHPGGRGLLLTAAGLDLGHFFDNYTVHSQSDKAANWLAPLAVGRLSEEDAERARTSTTPEVHVKKRMRILNRSRRRILVVAATLPLWMTVRSVVRLVGFFLPPLGRLLARALPVTVPGYSPGAEPLNFKQNANANDDEEVEPKYTVAVIGGGVAGCGAAWALTQSGQFRVVLYEARPQISGNARTFEWDFSPFRSPSEEQTVKSCVSVTAWPPIFYKNYTALLKTLDIETVHQPLSWFLNSKVPGAEGNLWGADPRTYPGSLREVFAKDFRLYDNVVRFCRRTTDFFTLKWTPWRRSDTPSMYDTHTGLGLLNPLTVVPLYSLYKVVGGSDTWWDVVFTPYYTASFLVDELRPFPAVFGPLIEAQIPLNPTPTNSWQGKSKRGENDCNITTCVTWKDAGKGIRQVFDRLVENVDVRQNTRVREIEVLPNGKKRVHDEYDNYIDVDRVILACPANAVGNILKKHSGLEDVIWSTPVYADDHHPSTGHMHAVMHSDPTVIDPKFREECLKRASNYVEVTRNSDAEGGGINIENQYNFGVQTPGPGIYDLPLNQKPVMLISHALGEGKSIDHSLIRGTGNHARAHPLYSGWNVAAMLCLRLVQGRDGVYYCSNWTTPGNCHDMSLLSGFVAAHGVGADYPFEGDVEARKDFDRLRDLMGV